MDYFLECTLAKPCILRARLDRSSYDGNAEITTVATTYFLPSPAYVSYFRLGPDIAKAFKNPNGSDALISTVIALLIPWDP